MGALCSRDDAAARTIEEIEDSPKQQLDLKELLLQLRPVEGDQASQDKLFENLKSHGYMLIATLVMPTAPGPQNKQRKSPGCCGLLSSKPAQGGSAAPLSSNGAEELRELAIVTYVRALMACRVWSKEVSLVKADGCKFFVFSCSAVEILRAACRIAQLIRVFPNWAAAAPELGTVPAVQLKLGIDVGDLLLLEEDCYGDPVNVSSKLGEDLAAPGDIVMSQQCRASMLCHSESGTLLNGLNLKEGSTTISKTQLEYWRGAVSELVSLLPALALPGVEEVSIDHIKPELQNVAVFVSDMSGFTRLTQKYGVLHYIRLILSFREIVETLVQRYEGQIITYDGDNVIATFPTCDGALSFAIDALGQATEYNKGRAEDFRLHVGCGLDYGQVFIGGHEITGGTFHRSFHLAEELSGAGEVLITKEFRKSVTPTLLTADVKISDDKTMG